ncbi:MAG: hypothetical protein ACTSX4_02915 [Candidatus Helarchaeota archaeon]
MIRFKTLSKDKEMQEDLINPPSEHESAKFCNKCTISKEDLEKYPIIYLNISSPKIILIKLGAGAFICPKCGSIT